MSIISFMLYVSSESKSASTFFGVSVSSIIGIVVLSQFIFQLEYFNFQANKYLFGIGWFLVALGFWFMNSSIESLRNHGGISETASIGITNTLVTTGFYSIVRNPIYLGLGILSLALVLTTQHWISLSCTIILIPLIAKLVSEEEILNETKFGDEYLEYMNQVPRFNILIGLLNCIKRKRLE